MSKEQLQLTVTKEESKTYKLLFKKEGKETKLVNCTPEELRMIREVINKVLLNN